MSQETEHGFHNAAHEVEISVAENVALNGAHFQRAQSKGLVLFWHGNTGNVARYEGHVHEFLTRGWDVLMVDYRSFGKSEGVLSQENILSDGLAVWDFAKEQYGYGLTILYGQSLGTGVASYVAAYRPADGLILEAPYYSIQRIGERLFPIFPIAYLLEYPLPNHAFIAEVDCPILAFHGIEDRTIPYAEHGAALKADFPHMRLIPLKNGTHNNCRTFPEYAFEMDGFLITLWQS